MLSMLLIGLAFAIVVYLCLVVVMIAGLRIVEAKLLNSRTFYCYPAIAILSIVICVLLCYVVSYTLYSYAYLMVGVVTGYMFYVFIFSGLYLLLSHKFIVPKNHALFITVMIPLVIGTVSLIKQKFIYVDYITLTYPGYHSITRICHLTDLHLGAIYQKRFVEKIVNRIRQEEPDVLVITGDLADGSMNVQAKWLEPFNSLSIPILYVTGNHEPFMGKEVILSVIGKTRINHIGNATEPVVIKDIRFIGCDHEDALDKRMNDFSSLLNSTQPVVLLAHSPKRKPIALAKYNIFLQLAGHTHKGQMFPFQLIAWIGNTCYYGLYSTLNKKHHVYVSAGVGSSLIPMRSLTRSEFGMITIIGEE